VLAIPFPDAHFDAICDFGLFETLHREDWPQYLIEISRVLKPGGYYLNVSLSRETQNFLNFHPVNEMSDGDLERYGIRYHFFTHDEMQNIFSSKFETISEQTELSKKQKGLVLLRTLFKKLP